MLLTWIKGNRARLDDDERYFGRDLDQVIAGLAEVIR